MNDHLKRFFYVAVAWFAAFSPAESAEPAARAPAPVKGYVSVVKEHAGQQTLLVRYLWKVHAQASIEVKMVPSDAAQGTSLSPQYFVADYFKGPLAEKINRCLDRAGDQGITDAFTKDKTEFKIIAQKNSLGRPAVLVIPSSEGVSPEKRPAAVFPLLDSWAVNDRLLALDLPRDGFAKPGKLSVWFLRGDKVLWEEQIAWPGMGK
jgi:hypothetical protein